MKKGHWQIRPSTFYLAVFLFTLANFLFPVGGLEFIAPIAAIPIFFYLRKIGYIKKFDLLTDLLLIAIYTVGGLLLLSYFGAFSLASTPWFKIIIIGMAADIIASVFGLFPIAGDAVSSLTNAVIAISIIGGIEGAIVAFALIIISMIPGPSLGANTLFLVLFKFISEMVI